MLQRTAIQSWRCLEGPICLSKANTCVPTRLVLMEAQLLAALTQMTSQTKTPYLLISILKDIGAAERLKLRPTSLTATKRSTSTR